MSATTDFETWLSHVNYYMVKRTGMGIDDLPDWHYYDAYDNGVPPSIAAREAIAFQRDY